MSTNPPPTGNPLATGNRLQRAYYRWAQPHYERIGRDDPELAREIEEVDQFLYSRRGAVVWLGCFLGLAGVMLGLKTVGDFDWLETILHATVLWFGFVWVVMSAWFSPKYKGKRSSRVAAGFGGGLLVGLLSGVVMVVFGEWLNHGTVDWERLQHTAERAALPALLLVLALSLAGCATSSPPVVPPPKLPPPPSELMVDPPRPNYSERVHQLLLEWQRMLTDWRRRS